MDLTDSITIFFQVFYRHHAQILIVNVDTIFINQILMRSSISHPGLL